MAKVNFLYIITKLELGGAQKQLLSLIRYLDKDKFNIFLFTAQEGLLLPEACSIDGLTIERSTWLQRPINPLKDLLALIEIYRFIKKNKIKLVHTHSSKAGILGRFAAYLAKTEVIIHTVHGWSFNDYQPKFWRRLFRWLERIAAQFTDRLIVVSYHDKIKGISAGIGREDKYSLIRYGIDYAEFGNIIKDGGVKAELGINPQDLVVGMVACFKPQKCPQDFIRLASLISQFLPRVKFLLIGDGILRRKIENLNVRFNLQRQVILTGWRRDIPRILSALDVFALTSLWEGLPVAVLEAMAASLPVIATSTAGIEELITENKNGFLVSCGDMAQMSKKLGDLLNNKELRGLVGQRAKSSLGPEFSLNRMVENTQNLYADLMLNKGLRYGN